MLRNCDLLEMEQLEEVAHLKKVLEDSLSLAPSCVPFSAFSLS